MRKVLAALVILLVAMPAGAQVVDTTPPDVVCAADSGAWHADNVAIPCTASDPETGIPDMADEAFDLTTSVLDGRETANASTDSRNVCNAEAVPLCTVAGPITGIKVDRKSPHDPTQVRSTDHRAGKWSRDRTIAISFNAGSDGGSGVDGFSRSWTHAGGSVPDLAKDLEQGARKTTSPRLGNGRWWFHLRTRDNVGNWTSTVHRGPFLIDFAKPRVKALGGSGKSGKKMRLRYRTADNNDRTRERLTISRGGTVLDRWTKGMGNARFSIVQGVSWRPSAAGSYSFCAQAWDRAGNTRRDCAAIRVKSPAPPGGGCSPAYPTVCIPPPPPDLDCGDIGARNFAVRPPDPHGFDGDGDGIGCET
jgi:hypothetical protein